MTQSGYDTELEDTDRLLKIHYQTPKERLWQHMYQYVEIIHRSTRSSDRIHVSWRVKRKHSVQGGRSFLQEGAVTAVGEKINTVNIPDLSPHLHAALKN